MEEDITTVFGMIFHSCPDATGKPTGILVGFITSHFE